MHFEDKSMVDGQKFQEKKLDTTKQPYELIWYQPISPSWMSSTRDMFGVDQVEGRAWHQVGKELKIEVTPNRKFEGIFGWDFQTLSTGNFHFDVKGENPWV